MPKTDDQVSQKGKKEKMKKKNKKKAPHPNKIQGNPPLPKLHALNA